MQTKIADSEPIIENEQEVSINAELLNKVADYVECHPKEFNMGTWGRRKLPDRGLLRFTDWLGITYPPPAYTVGCVACHTVRLGPDKVWPSNVPATAQRFLRLSDAQAHKLFYSDNWPQPFKREYNRQDSVSRAWVAAQRFRHFIATNGAE